MAHAEIEFTTLVLFAPCSKQLIYSQSWYVLLCLRKTTVEMGFVNSPYLLFHTALSLLESSINQNCCHRQPYSSADQLILLSTTSSTDSQAASFMWKFITNFSEVIFLDVRQCKTYYYSSSTDYHETTVSFPSRQLINTQLYLSSYTFNFSGNRLINV